MEAIMAGAQVGRPMTGGRTPESRGREVTESP